MKKEQLKAKGPRSTSKDDSQKERKSTEPKLSRSDWKRWVNFGTSHLS
ncbi:hypothetical protein KKA24_02720 [Patescibacteria group bacterium]|nr:hypothetical protein [Patescibacteria group bacterium]